MIMSTNPFVHSPLIPVQMSTPSSPVLSKTADEASKYGRRENRNVVCVLNAAKRSVSTRKQKKIANKLSKGRELCLVSSFL